MKKCSCRRSGGQGSIRKRGRWVDIHEWATFCLVRLSVLDAYLFIPATQGAAEKAKPKEAETGIHLKGAQTRR